MSATIAIQLNITVFTAFLFENYPTPSLDPKKPTQAPAELMHVVQTGGETSPMKGFSANNLQLSLLPEVQVQINVISESGNFDNPVVFYELYKQAGKHVLDLHTRLELYPDVKTPVPTSFEPLEITDAEKEFWFCHSGIRARGTGKYGIRVLVFNDDLSPFGYFEFPITIYVG